MPADERIKVVFRHVYILDDSDLLGEGEIYFKATVHGVPVGNPKQIFDADTGSMITLPEAQWSKEVNVHNTKKVVVTFHAYDEEVFSDEDLGGIRHTLKGPFKQELRMFRDGTSFFLLDWEVQLAAGGSFGRHPPSTVFTTRQNTGSVTCTTVSGHSFEARLECHPVRPVPRPAAALPVRPKIAALPERNDKQTTIVATSPMNVIPNPEVIPILGPPAAAPKGALPDTDDAKLAKDYANWANERNCARIEYTWYKPKSLNFTDDDRRLEWRAVPVAGGAVAFFGPARGRKVMVYGTAPGEVRLEVRFKGALFATYRALVQNIRQVPCRCNILNGVTGMGKPIKDATPRVTPADVKNHIEVSNRFMRQLGLQLTLDTNPARTHGAKATSIPGIFTINVWRGLTKNVINTRAATSRNYRAGVMNFAYIFSNFHDKKKKESPNLGAATDYPASGAGASITDTGTPSTSWVRPTGVGIGADATTVTTTMTLLTVNQRAGHPELFAMYLCDINGGAVTPAGNHRTPARQMVYANTMSHELGHILNLGHRIEGIRRPATPDRREDCRAGDARASMEWGGIFWDGMFHPPHESVMHWRDPPTTAQDFDLIQARAVQQSPLVSGAPIMPPATVPPSPPPPKGGHGQGVAYTVVYGDWLDDIARRHGMSGWKELWDYDGGTGKPNKLRLKSGDPDKIYPGEVIMVPATST